MGTKHITAWSVSLGVEMLGVDFDHLALYSLHHPTCSYQPTVLVVHIATGLQSPLGSPRGPQSPLPWDQASINAFDPRALEP
jgi:hypothetical protein